MTNFTKATLADRRVSVLRASVPLDTFAINVLSQVRKTISPESVSGLAEEIMAVGQLTPAKLVALTPAEAKQYVAEINHLWGSGHRLSRMKKCRIDHKDYYVFVVFGHRRLAACKLAAQYLKKGIRKSTNFDGRYRCEIVFGLSMLEAVFMQIGENSYVPPSLSDQLSAMWSLWRYLRRQNPKLSVRAFAKKIGQSEKKVLEMLRFTSLPESVQSWIEPGKGRVTVSYPLLLQVARLATAMRAAGQALSDTDIENMVLSQVARRVKVRDFKAEVSHRIEALRGGQSGLFGNMSETPLVVRRVAAAELVRAQYENLAYLKAIRQLAQRGLFGGDNPHLSKELLVGLYSPTSPAKLSTYLGRMILEVGQDLAAVLKAEGRPSHVLEKVLAELPVATELLELHSQG